MTTPKLCSNCIHYHVPASKEPCRDCLQQTVAVPNFKSKPSGWIEWNGGECPVPDETIVSVLFHWGGVISGCRACVWNWRRRDIVSYKVER